MIKLTGIRKEFGAHVIFQGLDCCINDNELVAITGPSGCGKTTLLNIIGLIDQEYQGELSFDGNIAKTMNKKLVSTFIRNHINYLFQNFALIDDDTVENNLMLALYYVTKSKVEKKQMIMEVLAKLGMESNVHKKIFTLSGGEQQRIALARVMLKPGEIVLADEPTGNLDKVNRDIVLNTLHELHKMGKTVIIVTHDDFVTSQCQRVIKL